MRLFLVMGRPRTVLLPGYARAKRTVLVAAAAFAALMAPFLILLDERTWQARIVDVVVHIGFGVLILGWCYYDSLERNQSLGAGLRALIVVFGMLALFIYLIRSRGWRRGLRSSGAALLVYAGIGLVIVISGLTTAALFGVE